MQCAHSVCAYVLVSLSCCVSTINISVCAFMYCMWVLVHRSVRMENLLNSEAGRLILHGLSKWREEEDERKSRYSHYRMHPAAVHSA